MFNIMDLFERIKLCLHQQLNKDEIINESIDENIDENIDETTNKIINETSLCFEEPILNVFINKQEGDYKECVICLEDMGKNQELILIKCSHIYHKKCLEDWISKNSICPLCDFKI